MQSPLTPTEQKQHVWQTVAQHIRERADVLKEQLVNAGEEDSDKIRGRILELRKLLEDIEPAPRYNSKKQKFQAESSLTGEAL